MTSGRQRRRNGLRALAGVVMAPWFVAWGQTQPDYPEIRPNGQVPGNIADKDKDGTYGDRYHLRVTGPGTLTVILRSDNFDAFLVVQDAVTGRVLCTDDDSAGGTDARCVVRFTDDTARTLLVVARPFTPGRGRYTLSTQFAADRPAPASSSRCPVVSWQLTAFESDPFSKGCRQSDGSLVRRYAFQVYRGQPAVIELVGPAGAETEVRLQGPSGALLSEPRRITTFLPTGSYALDIRRSAASPAGPYLLRTHGECTTNSLTLGQTVEEKISPADCRVGEFLEGDVEGGSYARKYEFELKERSQCRITCLGEGRGCYSATGETNSAVPEVTLVLSETRNSFYVLAEEDLFEARLFRLQLQCDPAPCPWQPLAVGDNLERQFGADDCRLCDYGIGGHCSVPAHAYSVASGELPLRIETSPPQVNLLDAAGRRLSNPLFVRAPYRFFAVFDASYRIRAVAVPPPCPDADIGRLLGAQSREQGPCGVQDREPDSQTTDIPLDESCRLVESNTFVRLFRFTLPQPGRFRAQVIPKGFTGARLVLVLRCGSEQVEADAVLDRMLPPGVHVLAVSSRNPTFGRFDLITRFSGAATLREATP